MQIDWIDCAFLFKNAHGLPCSQEQATQVNQGLSPHVYVIVFFINTSTYNLKNIPINEFLSYLYLRSIYELSKGLRPLIHLCGLLLRVVLLRAELS